MNKLLRSVYAASGFLACAAQVWASGIVSVTLDPNYPSDYSFYSFTATDGTGQNLPVAPYAATINEQGVYTNQSAYVICLDINNDDYVGQVYTGMLTQNTDVATMESTWLMNQLKNSGLSSAPVSVKGAISMAVWDLMFPSSTKAFGSYLPKDPAATAWETQASEAVANGSWTVAQSNRYQVFMPDDTTSQRYGLFLPGNSLATSEISASPEPSTWALAVIGGGLLVFSFYRRC